MAVVAVEANVGEGVPPDKSVAVAFAVTIKNATIPIRSNAAATEQDKPVIPTKNAVTAIAATRLNAKAAWMATVKYAAATITCSAAVTGVGGRVSV
jgi:hypothetical protein